MIAAVTLVGCAPGRGTGQLAAMAFQSSETGQQHVPWTGTPNTEPDTLRFAIVGDNTGLAKPGVFEQAMVQVGWLHPEFVIAIGDLIEGYTDDKAQLNRE